MGTLDTPSALDDELRRRTAACGNGLASVLASPSAFSERVAEAARRNRSRRCRVRRLAVGISGRPGRAGRRSIRASGGHGSVSGDVLPRPRPDDRDSHVGSRHDRGSRGANDDPGHGQPARHDLVPGSDRDRRKQVAPTCGAGVAPVTSTTPTGKKTTTPKTVYRGGDELECSANIGTGTPLTGVVAVAPARHVRRSRSRSSLQRRVPAPRSRPRQRRRWAQRTRLAVRQPVVRQPVIDGPHTCLHSGRHRYIAMTAGDTGAHMSAFPEPDRERLAHMFASNRYLRSMPERVRRMGTTRRGRSSCRSRSTTR